MRRGVFPQEGGCSPVPLREVQSSGGWCSPVPLREVQSSGGWCSPVPLREVQSSGGWCSPVPLREVQSSGGWCSPCSRCDEDTGSFLASQVDPAHCGSVVAACMDVALRRRDRMMCEGCEGGAGVCGDVKEGQVCVGM